MYSYSTLPKNVQNEKSLIYISVKCWSIIIPSCNGLKHYSFTVLSEESLNSEIVNNSTNINKTNIHFSLQTFDYKKEQGHAALEI